ncbi:MAG TPA: ABC transporter permease [Verrucomicrobiales bacterium]|nr:ABC transporter permease [Verrucomicrobiales bacterium]
MTRSLLTLRSLAHYWRWHLGLFLGVMLTAGVISGSLVTGDSVRATLARQAEIRLGRIATAAAATDGFFTYDLANKAREKIGGNQALEPVLFLQGTVTEPGAKQRAGGVNIYGVTSGFWGLGNGNRPPLWSTAEFGVLPPRVHGFYINEALASALGIRPVSSRQESPDVILRFEKPGFISRDAPLSGESDQTVTMRLKVDGIIADEAMGAFSLAAGQTPPLNAWLPLAKLQEAAQLQGRANLLLSTAPDKPAVETALRESLTIEDAGLSLTGTGDYRVLSTGRIFLSDDIAGTVKKQFPDARGVLTYLVNEIRANGKLTPYSMATAAALPGAENDAAKSVRINQWLADDLGAKAGDPIKLKYFRVTRARQLEEAEADFTIAAVLPMTDPSVRRDWTPDFPGVTEAENCRDWKPGIPINQEIVRDKDDAYWKQYKGTPKLWLPLPVGQEIWANRFGSLTSFQIPAKEETAAVAAKLAAALTPAAAGINVVAVKEAAAHAVSDSMDFGVLFVSMSAFLIITALLLAALLFIFGIEQRAAQCGVLRASGWTGREVRRLFLMEGFWIAAPAAVAGVFTGGFYTRWTLGKLESDWSDAALGLKFLYTAKPLSLVIAAAVTLLLAFAVIWWASRRLLRAQPRTLLAGSVRADKTEKPSRLAKVMRFIPIGVATAAAIAMLVFTQRVPQHIAPMLFFGAAFFLLIDGVRLLHWRLRRMEARAVPDGPPSVWALGVRNTARRRGRSAALAGLLALGIFMVTALNAFRQDARLTNNTRDSGAGGFMFIGESTLPVYEDLNSNAGQKAWDFDPEELAGVKFVPFRVRDGEEASCLNLNRAQTPRVLGVNTAAIPADAFPFASESKPDARWQILNADGGDAINVIMDQYSAMFALGKKEGDIITVPDGQGRPVNLRIASLLAGTVLQGNVIMGEEHFVRLYPDTRGYRFFLVDVPAQRAESFRKLAVEQLTTRGFTLTSAPQRLAQFQAVQNTYLTIFSTLGGMALLLSTIGLAILVARHVLERRAEFATLAACGFLPGQLRLMILAEHWFLLIAAVVLGSVTALLAVWPNLRLAGAGGLPFGTLSLILLALLAGGLLFCWLAARLALTRRVVTALRYE